MEITATGVSLILLVLFRLYVFSLFSAENDRSTDAVAAGTVSTIWGNFVASGTVGIRLFWANKLRNCPADLHSSLAICKPYSPKVKEFGLS